MERCWDVDKAHSLPNANKVAPVAGMRAPERIDLHHFQTNTLAASDNYLNVGQTIDVDRIFARGRKLIAEKGGVRHAMLVYKNFVLADDDVDDEIDQHEFRAACKQSAIAFSDDEEEDIFLKLGSCLKK